MDTPPPAPITPLGARTPHAHPALPGFIGGLALLILAGAYLVYADASGHWPYSHTTPPVEESPVPTASPSPSPVSEYRNATYGFFIPLPADWQGYSVIVLQWQGTDVATGNVTEHGPKIVLRNPKWTAAAPYEDMPVLVFTPAQWAKVQAETLSLGAAPIGPSLLGQNSKYILALPARYNFDYNTGFEEVDTIVHSLKAFQP